MPQGHPLAVPDDGLTTRARRNAPLLAVHTGAGKGKSTAAFGMALRAWNQGFDVAVFQFVKSAKWKVGEEAAFRDARPAARRARRRRAGRMAQDGVGLVVVAQGGHRGRPRGGGGRRLGRDRRAGSPRSATTSTCSTSSPIR